MARAADGRADQVWAREIEGHAHRVEAAGSVRRRVRWSVDGTQVAVKTSTSERIKLSHGGHRLLVVHSITGRPLRASVDDTDLVPEPGSPATEHERRVLEHPNRYAAIEGLGGVGKVLLPIILTSLAALLWHLVRPLLPDLPAIPWPDLPAIPWPDLPDLPSVPWPDLPDVHLPDWLVWVLDNAHYVVPVVVAVVLARAEVRRRHRQAERGSTGDDGGNDGGNGAGSGPASAP